MLSQSAHGESELAEQAASLEQIYQTARELTRAMDEIVWAVNPKHDTLDSLAAYLGKYAQDFCRPVGIRCRIEMPLDLPPLHLTAEVRHNLFLAFEEALNNVVKHSGANEVRISLRSDAEGFMLMIEDNGRGFAVEAAVVAVSPRPDRVAGGNGLANMHARIEKLNGRCEIVSAPGEGVKVKFIVRTSSLP
jgi:signal transduction histidine kinase